MNSIHVYCESPVKQCEPINKTIKEQRFLRDYKYTFNEESQKDNMSQALDFIFYALIQKIVENTFKVNKTACSLDTKVADTFSLKLSHYLCKTGIKRKIDNIIKLLLKEGNTISIDGIIRFRLKEFSNDISAFFDMMFHEYKVQKQYEDFVHLVRDYIATEKPKEKVIHVQFNKKGFRLYNTKMQDITEIALKSYKRDGLTFDGNYNDFLISSLLEYLPQNIIIHAKENAVFSKIDSMINKKIIETIKTIFANRVKLCQHENTIKARNNCPICSNNISKAENELTLIPF